MSISSSLLSRRFFKFARTYFLITDIIFYWHLIKLEIIEFRILFLCILSQFFMGINCFNIWFFNLHWLENRPDDMLPNGERSSLGNEPFFVVWLTNEKHLTLFPARSIVRDSHHCESICCKLDLNMGRTWV